MLRSRSSPSTSTSLEAPPDIRLVSHLGKAARPRSEASRRGTVGPAGAGGGALRHSDCGRRAGPPSHLREPRDPLQAHFQASDLRQGSPDVPVEQERESRQYLRVVSQYREVPIARVFHGESQGLSPEIPARRDQDTAFTLGAMAGAGGRRSPVWWPARQISHDHSHSSRRQRPPAPGRTGASRVPWPHPRGPQDLHPGRGGSRSFGSDVPAVVWV